MNNSRTVTLADAVKESRPTAFSTIVKPAGSACNLDCSYCYYLDKAIQYGGKEAVMSDDLLREYIRQYITANAAPEVTFCWHGGEPLLLGLDFYKKAMAWQREYSNGKKIVLNLDQNAHKIDIHGGFFVATATVHTTTLLLWADNLAHTHQQAQPYHSHAPPRRNSDNNHRHSHKNP